MRRLIPSALAAVALAGCGGDTKTDARPAETRAAPETATTPARDAPRPAESAELAVARLAKAARAGHCSAPRELIVDNVAASPRFCRRLVAANVPVLPPRVKTYGSGAVVVNTNGGQTILALDSDRRFKFVIAFGNEHVPKVPVKTADDAMSHAVGAIRRDNCGDLTPWAFFGRSQKFCGQKAIRQLHAALGRDYTASPTALGGDGTFAFYGLRADTHYFTLVFLAAKNGSYSFVTSVRA